VGIDPSLTKTGLVCLNALSGKVVSHALLDATKLDRTQPFGRIWFQVQELGVWLRSLPEKPSLIGIEDFAFIPNNRIMYETGELVGAMKMMLFKMKIPILFTLSEKKKKGKIYRNILMISPAQVRKYALGSVPKGKGKSNPIPLTIYKQWGVEFDSDDEADAYVIARITRSVFLPTVLDMTEDFNDPETQMHMIEVIYTILDGLRIVRRPNLE